MHTTHEGYEKRAIPKDKTPQPTFPNEEPRIASDTMTCKSAGPNFVVSGHQRQFQSFCRRRLLQIILDGFESLLRDNVYLEKNIGPPDGQSFIDRCGMGYLVWLPPKEQRKRVDPGSEEDKSRSVVVYSGGYNGLVTVRRNRSVCFARGGFVQKTLIEYKSRSWGVTAQLPPLQMG